MDAPIDRTECLKTIWCWTLGTASLRACRRTMNIDCPSPHGHARLTVTRAYRCAARPRGGNAVRRNRHRSRVPCRATDHAGSAVERRLTLRVTLQESPIELHESPVDELYTSAVVLTGSSGSLSASIRGLVGSPDDRLRPLMQPAATPASSPDAHLEDERGVHELEHHPDLRRPDGGQQPRTLGLVLHVCCRRAGSAMFGD